MNNRIILKGRRSGSLAMILLLSVCAQTVQADLLQAIKATHGHHPALAGKRAEVQASEFQLEATQAQRFPSISGQVGQDNNDRSVGSLQVKQPVWAFGKIDNAIARDATAIHVETADLALIKQDLTERTALAYADVIAAREQLVVLKDNVEAHQTLHAHIISRGESQLAAEADVTLSESRLIQARAQLLQVESALRQAQDTLKALTQIPVESDVLIDTKDLILPNEPTMRLAILDHSPDLKHKEMQRELAHKELDVQRVNHLPTLSLQLDHTRSINSSLSTNDTDQDTRLMLTLEAGISGLGFAARGLQRQAGARLTAAERDLDVVRNDLERRVNTLFITQTMNTQLTESRQRTVAAYESTLESYFRQYRAGKKSWLDVLNMRRELNQQQLEQLQSQYDGLKATLSLAVLSGHLNTQIKETLND